MEAYRALEPPRYPASFERKSSISLSILLIVGTQGIYDDKSAMLLMLASFWLVLLLWWSYRRAVRAPKSGWLRIGAALTLFWAGILTLVGLLSGVSEPWTFYSFVIGPIVVLWLIGFAFAWVRRVSNGPLRRRASRRAIEGSDKGSMSGSRSAIRTRSYATQRQGQRVSGEKILLSVECGFPNGPGDTGNPCAGTRSHEASS